MARIAASLYKPQLNFRFQLSFSNLPQAIFYVKSMDLPVASNNSIEIDYGNTSFFVKGKTRWNKLNCTTYAYEGITISEIKTYLYKHQQVTTGIDQFKDTYNTPMAIIQLQDPTGVPTTQFQLYNVYLDEVTFGQVDWSGNEVIEPGFTLVYDYCEVI